MTAQKVLTEELVKAEKAVQRDAVEAALPLVAGK